MLFALEFRTCVSGAPFALFWALRAQNLPEQIWLRRLLLRKCRTHGQLFDFFGHALPKIFGSRAVRHPTADQNRRSGRSLAGTPRAFLAIHLALCPIDFRPGFRGGIALSLIGQTRFDRVIDRVRQMAQCQKRFRVNPLTRLLHLRDSKPQPMSYRIPSISCVSQ